MTDKMIKIVCKINYKATKKLEKLENIISKTLNIIFSPFLSLLYYFFNPFEDILTILTNICVIIFVSIMVIVINFSVPCIIIIALLTEPILIDIRCLICFIAIILLQLIAYYQELKIIMGTIKDYCIKQLGEDTN